jgi:hypothetical protein
MTNNWRKQQTSQTHGIQRKNINEHTYRKRHTYRSITLSQYLYNAPLLGSASSRAKKEMEKQQHIFFNIIGITMARAFEINKIEPIATFLDHQCVNLVELILKKSPQYKKLTTHLSNC